MNRPNDKVLCTFVQSGSAWVSVIHTGVKMRLKFANGQTLDVGAPPLETFQVLRGSPVLFALSCVVAGGVARYGFSVSVGGSSVVTVYQSDMPAVKPTSIRFGDTANNKVEAMLWYGGRIHESEERDDKQMEASLRNLDMLFQKAVPVPPGQIM